MKTYTFYLQHGSAGVPAFEIEMFDDREAAFDFARRLLDERRRYDQVAVVEDSTEIARFDRPETRPARPEQRWSAQG